MSDRNNENREVIEITLWDIFNILWKKAWLITFFGIFCGIVVLGYTKFFVTPQFTSTTKIYIMSKQDEATLTQGDMQTSTYLTKDYAEMIKSRTVTEKVIKQLGLNMENSDLLDKMSIKVVPDARIISISVRDKDPREAAEIADAIREEASKHIQNVMDIEAVNVVEEANIPKTKSSPSLTKYTLIGVMGGAVVLMLLILLLAITNDTIQISDDVEKRLGISVLSVIPKRENVAKSKRKGKRRKQYGRS